MMFSRLAQLRQWTQDNGEKAALFGILFGISLVLFFKLVVFILVASALIVYAAMCFMGE